MHLREKSMGWKLENTYFSLPKIFYSEVRPTSVVAPEAIIINGKLAEGLGLNPEYLAQPEGIALLAGNALPKGSLPLAQAYAGHQFGHFTMLGDGRAVLIGEQITPEGRRYDLQYKGSGRTPYSRGGDGRAVLGPMLREYLISEAMHALRIPTTRSLAVIKTGESVLRERELPGAILTRVASSHIRIGTFQFAAAWGKQEDLRALADYTITRHFPWLLDQEQPYRELLAEVVKLQAELIARWQLVGFVHGVMNTDNVLLCGETIDYGPCAFMDTYHPETVFSSIDSYGRYAYGNQPRIAEWNLARFAEALLPLFDKNVNKSVNLAQEEIERFSPLFQAFWLQGMRNKLGLSNEEVGDEGLIKGLLELMQHYVADYTNTFRMLTLNGAENKRLIAAREYSTWHEKWQQRLQRQQKSKEEIALLMRNNNPALIPRNHLVEAALEAAEKGNYEVMTKLKKALAEPYSYAEDYPEYIALPSKKNKEYRTYCGT